MNEDKNNVLIAAKQAAEMMGYTPGGLRMRRLRKQAPMYYKVGGKIMYDIEDVKAFIQSGKVMPADQGKQDE
ncbi:MAG: hypothetical protein V4544_06865 [Pseudomonadota bacterium]